MKRMSLVAILAVTPLAGCASASGGRVATQMQVRELQTRSYETGDTRIVLKAVLDALQDEAFVIRNADAALGLVTASKETVINRKALRAARWLAAGLTYGLALLVPVSDKETAVLEATAHVTEFGPSTRVRVSFELRSLDKDGKLTRVRSIDDAEFYQRFFAKVDKGLFLARERL